MPLKKGSQVTTAAPLASVIAGKDPATNGKHIFKSSSQMSTANTATGAANAVCTLTYAAAGVTLQHVISGITVSLAGGTVGTLAAATGTLTSNNTTPTDGDTVTIDTKVYTFKTALTPTEGQVLINGSADAALLNLIRAINHSGTPGTDYSAAAAHPTVTAATSVTSHAFAITAKIPGTQTNSGGTSVIATTTVNAGPTLSWGATTLAGGVGAMVQIKDGTSIVFNASIAAAGQQQFMFDPPLKGALNSALTITCGPAGSGVSTSINALHWTE